MNEQSIRTLQQNLPWGAHSYNEAFRARTDAPRDAIHAFVHFAKAIGKIVRANVDAEGQRETAKGLADLLICAARVANTWPGGPIDLAAAYAAATQDLDIPWTGCMEALAIIAGPLDELEHVETPDPASRETAAAGLGALLRVAETLARYWGGEAIDLDVPLAERLAEKFPGAPAADAPLRWHAGSTADARVASLRGGALRVAVSGRSTGPFSFDVWSHVDAQVLSEGYVQADDLDAACALVEPMAQAFAAQRKA